MFRVRLWCAWLVFRGQVESVEWDTDLKRVTVRVDSARWFAKKAVR
jgi:hypothetical protein